MMKPLRPVSGKGDFTISTCGARRCTQKTGRGAVGRITQRKNRDCHGSIPLENEEARHRGSQVVRKVKNRTLKTEGCGTQKIVSVAASAPPGEDPPLQRSKPQGWATPPRKVKNPPLRTQG